MGAVASSLSKPTTLTGKQFRDNLKTKELQAMSNELFKFMYSKWDIREIFDIADNPGEYVIAISDLITQQFHVLGYTTRRNKIGEIYFEKWSELDPPKTTEELGRLTNSNATRKQRIEKLREKTGITRAEAGAETHKQHAQIIAFYFVRIFQILGSLLLVVKDSTFPDIDDSGSIRQASNIISSRAYADQAYKVVPRFKSPSQAGGAESYFPPSVPLGPFEFIRYYLRSYDRDTIENYRKNYNLTLPESNGKLYKFQNNPNLFFEYTLPDPLPPVIGTDVNSGARQKFGMFIKKASSTSPTLEFINVIVSSHDAAVGTVTREYKAPGDFKAEEQFNRYPREVALQIKSASGAKLYDASFVPAQSYNANKSYTNGLPYKLRGGSIYDIVTSELDAEKDFVNILDRFVILSMRKSDGLGVNIKKFVPTVKDTRDSIHNVGSIEGPKNQAVLLDTFNELNNKKHAPHCIARALQLLDAASINNVVTKNPGVTRICSSDINGTGKSYKPLRALGQLYGKLNVTKVISVNKEEFKQAETILKAFVGKESVGEPITVDTLKGTLNQASESSDLASAIQKLSKAFHTNLKLEEKFNSFEDIKLQRPDACAGDKVIEVSRGGPVFLDLQRQSQKLLAFHLNNIIDISKFLKTVFNMSQRGDGSWQVEGPKTEIMFAGFQVLDDLTDQTRQLLIKYYSGCEDIYQAGVKNYIDSGALKTAANASKPREGQLLPGSNPTNPVIPSNTRINNPSAP